MTETKRAARCRYSGKHPRGSMTEEIQMLRFTYAACTGQSLRIVIGISCRLEDGVRRRRGQSMASRAEEAWGNRKEQILKARMLRGSVRGYTRSSHFASSLRSQLLRCESNIHKVKSPRVLFKNIAKIRFSCNDILAEFQ